MARCCCCSLLEHRRRWPEEVVRRPEVVDGARAPRVEPDPWLPLAAPMEEADGPRVEATAPPLDVVAAEAVLVPAVVDGLDVTGEHEEERRQRAEVVDPRLLLHLHPPLDAAGVAAGAPLADVHDHDAGVEVARAAAGERAVERRVRPERVGEVVGEVGVAILGRADDVAAEVDGRQRADVVDDHHVGVEVDAAAHVGRERVGEVDARVVERLVERVADGAGDAAADAGRVEAVHAEVQVRERGAHRRREVGVHPGREEVERHALRARRVLQDGQHAGHGAPEVVGVQRHGHVHPPPAAALLAVAERGGLPEARDGRRRPPDHHPGVLHPDARGRVPAEQDEQRRDGGDGAPAARHGGGARGLCYDDLAAGGGGESELDKDRWVADDVFVAGEPAARGDRGGGRRRGGHPGPWATLGSVL